MARLKWTLWFKNQKTGELKRITVGSDDRESAIHDGKNRFKMPLQKGEESIWKFFGIKACG